MVNVCIYRVFENDLSREHRSDILRLRIVEGPQKNSCETDFDLDVRGKTFSRCMVFDSNNLRFKPSILPIGNEICDMDTKFEEIRFLQIIEQRCLKYLLLSIAGLERSD